MPDLAALALDPKPGLALLDQHAGRVAFEGIALGPGVYTDAANRKVRVRVEHLPLVAQRMEGCFLRDLHREDIGASVGVVSGARVEGEEVRFTGDVRLAPYVDIVREFWPSVCFSLGFRYDPSQLKTNDDGTFDLPLDFLVDHLALVPQGQYPNARLVKLLNQARTALPRVPSPSPPQEPATMPDTDTKELDNLRQQRDDALTTATQRQKELELARVELGKARVDLDAASKLAEAARLELGQAKNRVAGEVMKLELAAGKDFDLDQRKKDLTGLELAALDKLRGELRLAAKPDTAPPAPQPEPTTRRDPVAQPGQPSSQGIDLSTLSLGETLRLAFQRGAF